MFEYRAACLNVHDGDTLTLLIDVGFGARVEEAVRLMAVSAPELNQPGGPQCRDFTAAWVAALPSLHWPVGIQTVPTSTIEPTERRSFVRYLGYVVDQRGGRVLNTDLARYLDNHPEWGHGT